MKSANAFLYSRPIVILEAIFQTVLLDYIDSLHRIQQINIDSVIAGLVILSSLRLIIHMIITRSLIIK